MAALIAADRGVSSRVLEAFLAFWRSKREEQTKTHQHRHELLTELGYTGRGDMKNKDGGKQKKMLFSGLFIKLK